MTEGIDYIYLETYDWNATLSFWQALGFELEFDLGTSGRLVHAKDGNALFVQQVPKGQPLSTQIYIKAGEHQKPSGESSDWQPSHWGTELMELEDPDGRPVKLQRPAS